MNEKADKLRRILEYAVSLKEYQRSTWPNGQPKTFCNLFCKGVLNAHAARYFIPSYVPTDFSYDITSMNPGKYLNQIMLNTDTRTEYTNVMRMARSGKDTAYTHDEILPSQSQKYPIEVNEFDGYDMARQGIPIWVVSAELPPIGHEVVICPDDSPYDEARGNRIANVGWINGFFYMSQIFQTLWRNPKSDIRYFLFPQEEN